MCSSSSTASPRNVEVRYTKFTISGIPGEKHAVFVPDGLKLTLHVFAQICSAINQEVPSGFISGMSCLRHPARLSNRQLRECQGFQRLMEEARCSLGLQPGLDETTCSLDACTPRGSSRDRRSAELRPGDLDSSGRCLADVANRVLEKKIASAVGSVAAAAQRANAWVLSGAQVSNFEVLLQQCVESGEVSVFRLVVGHLQDKAYMKEDASRLLLQQLFAASHTMSAQTVYRVPAVALQGDLWNPRRNTSHPEFGRYGYDYWSFITHDDKLSEGHPITEWPWPYGDLFILFYHEDTIGSSEQPSVDWDYTTRVRHDQDAIPFDPEVLATTTHVCIGGNELSAKRRLLQALKILSPVIVLDNTPGVPKQLSLLLNAIHRVWLPAPLTACRPFLADGSLTQLWGSPSSKELLQALSPSKLLQHVEREFDSSGMDESERLSLSDIVGLLDLAQRRPQAFREAACVLDPLRHSADEAVAMAMVLLNSRQAAYREPGSGSELHRSLVLKAWRLHRKLAQEAARLRTFTTTLLLSIAGALLLTTILAVSAVSICLQKADFEEINYHVSAIFLHEKLELSYTWSEAIRVLNACLLVLPVVAVILAVVQAYFRFFQRWANVHMVGTLVVSEIYHFLGGLGPYAGLQAVSQRLLMRRLQDLVKKLSLPGHEELLEGGGGEEEDFPKDPRALEEHVDQHLYGVAPPGWLSRRAEMCPASVRSLAGGWASEPKDLTAQLSAELYVDVRVVPLRRHYRSRARVLARRRLLLNAAFLAALGLAAGLGAWGAYVWVPVPLSIASFLAAVTHWLAPPEMLAAVTNALAVLSSLDLRWHGSDIRENRSEASKQRLIANAERISRIIAMVYTGSNSMSDYNEDDAQWSGDSHWNSPRAGDEKSNPPAAEQSW